MRMFGLLSTGNQIFTRQAHEEIRNIIRNISVIEQAEGLGEQRVPQMEWIFGGVYG